MKRKLPVRLRRFLDGDDIRSLAKHGKIGERMVQKVLKGNATDMHGILPLALKKAEKKKSAQLLKEKNFQERISQL